MNSKRKVKSKKICKNKVYKPCVTFNRAARSISREFCSETTILHVYIAESKRAWIERYTIIFLNDAIQCLLFLYNNLFDFTIKYSRLFWAFALGLLIILCIYATMGLWTNWQKRPVMLSSDDTETSIGTIPFPAITICSSEKFDATKIIVPLPEEILYALTGVKINNTWSSEM